MAKIKAKREDWIDRKWRPLMGMLYFFVCMMDFIIFPIAYSWMMVKYGGQVTSMWEPLTLKGGGLFHVAMGAVLGVAAWSRGQEKITKYQSGVFDHHDNVIQEEQVEEVIENTEVVEPISTAKPYRYRGRDGTS